MNLSDNCYNLRSNYQYGIEYNAEFDRYQISEMNRIIKDRIAGNSRGWVFISGFDTYTQCVKYINEMS